MFFGYKRLYEQQVLLSEALRDQVATLQQQVKDYRDLALPSSKLEVPFIALEANAVLDGKEKPVEITDNERHAHEQVLRERDRLLSGMYDAEEEAS